MTHYLVDNSVLQRLSRSPEVRRAVQAIMDDDGELCCCAASLDEFAFSARSEAGRAEAVIRLRSGFCYLPFSEAIDERIVDIRAALFRAGRGRAAGVIDVQIAAIAAEYGATVLHYDADFDHISRAYPEARSRWVVPRGSLD